MFEEEFYVKAGYAALHLTAELANGKKAPLTISQDGAVTSGFNASGNVLQGSISLKGKFQEPIKVKLSDHTSLYLIVDETGVVTHEAHRDSKELVDVVYLRNYRTGEVWSSNDSAGTIVKAHIPVGDPVMRNETLAVTPVRPPTAEMAALLSTGKSKQAAAGTAETPAPTG